jgi:hypothetical protein
VVTFHNGISINIPIEGEIGFNMLDTVKIKPFTEEEVIKAWQQLNDTRGSSNAGTEEALATSI